MQHFLANQSLISCQNLSYFWQPASGVRQVSFTLAAGQRLGIIGPNGAGKSTLLKLLAGLLPPQQGEVLLWPRPLSDYLPRQRAVLLALLEQDHQAQPHCTVSQLVSLGLLPHKALWQGTTDADRQKISLALAQVGLTDQASQPLQHLSGGELQRAQLARVLVQGARLLLLDEPTNHLDVKFQHQLLQQIHQSGLSLIASFHDLNLAASYCDQLLLLQHGAVVQIGTPTQVLQGESLSRVFGLDCRVDQNPFNDKPRVTFAPGAL